MMRHLIALFLLSLLTTLGCDADREPASDAATDSAATLFKRSFEETHFEGEVTLSPRISTVGIVTWSAKGFTPESAVIEFGPDTGYGWTAPVNLYAPDNRTLLLGMKPSRTYHFRITARAGDRRFQSNDYTVETGNAPSDLPEKSVQLTPGAELAEGFVITCAFMGHWAFILDRDGDYVWWHDIGHHEQTDCVRARLDATGTHMYLANGNVPGPENGALARVSLDGLKEERYALPMRHHDVTVLPDGTVTFIEYDTAGQGTCDVVKEMAPGGAVREVFRVRDHFGHRAADDEWCHSNAINYIPSEEAYTLSILNMNTIVKFDRSGDLIWVFGGQDSDFPGVSWEAQHQHHLADGRLLIFNNRGDGGSPFEVFSRALEFAVDETGRTASKVWEYEAGRMFSIAMGDARRLENGNTLVTFSSNGVIHEVDPAGVLQKEIRWGMGGSVGYATWRVSLYGGATD